MELRKIYSMIILHCILTTITSSLVNARMTIVWHVVKFKILKLLACCAGRSKYSLMTMNTQSELHIRRYNIIFNRVMFVEIGSAIETSSYCYLWYKFTREN